MTYNPCSIEDCDAPQIARGWCSRHYQRWRAYGDPEAPIRHRPPQQVLEHIQDLHGEDPEEIIRSTGMTASGIGQALRRAGRPDLARPYNTLASRIRRQKLKDSA